MFECKLFCISYNRSWITARGRLEGNPDGTLALLSGPLAPDPVLYPGCYSARDPPRPPRIGLNATHILERGQRGVVGALLKLEGASLTPNTSKPSKCRSCVYPLPSYSKCLFQSTKRTYTTFGTLLWSWSLRTAGAWPWERECASAQGDPEALQGAGGWESTLPPCSSQSSVELP